MYDLDTKVALVTGAASRLGIGRAVAVRLAKEGADVVVADKYAIPPAEKDRGGGWRGLESVVAEIEALGRQSMALTVDVSRGQEVEQMVEKVLAKFGKIDILANSAGVGGTRDIPVTDMTDEAWQFPIQVNLNGVFHCCRAVAREMVKRGQGGKIVNVASVAGKMGMARGRSAYSASKFGVVGLTQCLALELAPHKISVNAICPGVVSTDLNVDFIRSEAKRLGISEDESRRRYYDCLLPNIPLARFASPDEMANVVVFLASKEADYITGQSINVDGGLLMAH